MKSELKNQLDDPEEIKKTDVNNIHSSLILLPDQIKQTFNDISHLDLSRIKREISSLYFCAMGGSAYAGRIIKSLYKSTLKIPVTVVDDYQLPSAVNNNSLVICASYSGNTEETLTACGNAVKKKLMIFGVSSGGKLISLLKNNGLKYYRFNPVFNPSGQPRLGQGYMIIAQLVFLSKLNLIPLNNSNIKKLIGFLSANNKTLISSAPVSGNSAKQLALISGKKIINLVSGEFLSGVLHAIRNSVNETGKHFANYFLLPELNHHLLEGLKFPVTNKNSLIFIFIESGFFSFGMKKRISLTREIVEKENIQTFTIVLNGQDELEQVFELLQLFSFVSFYLAVLHKVNPAPVPWVDYFKKHL